MAHSSGEYRISAELAEDLKLLGVSANGYETDDEVHGARDKRIKKLKEVNGTLDKVCFTTRLFSLGNQKARHCC